MYSVDIVFYNLKSQDKLFRSTPRGHLIQGPAQRWAAQGFLSLLLSLWTSEKTLPSSFFTARKVRPHLPLFKLKK